MTISWIQAILLGIFASLFNAQQVFQHGELYTRSSLIGILEMRQLVWSVDPSFISLRQHLVVLCSHHAPFSLVFLCYLVCACHNITDEAGIAAAAAPIKWQPLGQSSSSFLRQIRHESCLVWQHIGWKAAAAGNFKTYVLTGLPLDLSSLLFFFQ